LNKLKVISLLVSSALLAGCGNNSDTADSSPVTKVQESTAKVESTKVALSESEKANALFEEIFMGGVMRSLFTVKTLKSLQLIHPIIMLRQTAYPLPNA